MKPLRVLLVHRDQWHRWLRIDGQFAYDVPEFRVSHWAVGKWFHFDLTAEKGHFDVVWWDEGKHKGGPHFLPKCGKHPVPVAYYCLYPTLAEHIWKSRRERAEQDADLVLLEHDRIDRWDDLEIPVRRCAYSVNEFYYRDQGLDRDIDVGFYSVWNYSPERRALHEWLEMFCAKYGYTYYTTMGKNVETEYPDLLARTKVAVHINRTPATRPPRLFDASACGCAVLASRAPAVSGENWIDGVHYVAFDNPTAHYREEKGATVEPYTDDDCAELAEGLTWLIGGQHWRAMAGRARRYVLNNHTWHDRARELRLTFAESLGV
jgi:hypothetical protein